MRIENIEQVRAKLYEFFNKAAQDSCNPTEWEIQNRIAIGTLGGAIAAIEREQREAAASAPARLQKTP